MLSPPLKMFDAVVPHLVGDDPLGLAVVQRAEKYRFSSSKKIQASGSFGGRRALARHLLHEILDGRGRLVDLLVELAVDLQRPIETDGAKGDATAFVARGDGRRNRRRRPVE